MRVRAQNLLRVIGHMLAIKVLFPASVVPLPMKNARFQGLIVSERPSQKMVGPFLILRDQIAYRLWLDNNVVGLRCLLKKTLDQIYEYGSVLRLRRLWM